MGRYWVDVHERTVVGLPLALLMVLGGTFKGQVSKRLPQPRRGLRHTLRRWVLLRRVLREASSTSGAVRSLSNKVREARRNVRSLLMREVGLHIGRKGPG